jgi:hypothetical protein
MTTTVREIDFIQGGGAMTAGGQNISGRPAANTFKFKFQLVRVIISRLPAFGVWFGWC